MPTYATTTLSALRQRCRERLFTTFWTDAELNAYINEALRVWNSLTGYWKTTTTVTVPGGTTYYSLVDNISNYLFLVRVELDTYHLNLVSLVELDHMIPTWQCEQGPPTEAAIIGLDRIAFHPHPLVDTDMDITYIRKAPVLTSDGDYVQLSEEELAAIRNYVHFLAALKEGGVELQSAIPYMKDFMAAAGRYNSKLNKISSLHKLLGWAGYDEARPVQLDAEVRRGLDVPQR